MSPQPNDESIVVGMTNGILSVKHKKSPEESKESSGHTRRQPTYRVFVKGKNYVPKQVSWVHLIDIVLLSLLFKVVLELEIIVLKTDVLLN